MKSKYLWSVILILLLGTQSYAQKGQVITGIVVDETKAPVVGVSIVEKGTHNGVATDMNGRYSITLKSDKATLTYNLLGYQTKESIVNNQRDINMQMTPVATEMNEVVVVGYGFQKKASVVGAISTLSPSQVANTSKTNLSQSLAGNIAGILAVQRSGELGNDHADFWIRGINTFKGGSNPLIMVDGVERDFNSIDPQEIESFSVLKDASATAIYGVRGANGVIAITTKKGFVGKPKVSVSTEFAIKQPTVLPKFVDAVDYMKIANEANKMSNNEITFLPERINRTIDNYDPDLYPNINWVDELLKPFTMHERVNVNVSGGAPKVRYFISSSYHHENGLFKSDTDREWDSNIGMNKINFRANLDADITSTTTVNVNLGSQLSSFNKSLSSSDEIWKLMMEIPPYFIPVRYSDGRLSAYGAGSEKGLNPYNKLTQSGTNRSTENNLNATGSVNQKLDFVTKGLSAKVLYAYDVWTNHNLKSSFQPELWYATGRSDDGVLEATQVEPGNPFLKKQITSQTNYTTYLEAVLNYNRTFGHHQVTAMALYNQRIRNVESGSTEYDVIPYRYQGVAGRATYNFKGRYFGEFNFGYNGSENFAKGNRFGFFPSVAVGWLISDEPFWNNVRPVVSKLKIRGSIGQVGNDVLANGRFAYITEIKDDGGYNFGIPGSNNSFNGVAEGKFGYSSLTWEAETKRDIGVEIGLWNSLDIDIDYFYNNRKDILIGRSTIPGTAGLNENPNVNYGKMENKGFDASVKYNQTFGDWHISAMGTFTFARNKILEMDEPTQMYSNLYKTGHRFNQQTGLIADGLYKDSDFDTGGNLLQHLPVPDLGVDVKPGDIKYVDVNGDGIIDLDDETAIGHTETPEIVYGFGINVTYKGFDMGVRFQGVANTTRMLNNESFLPFARTMQKGNLYKDIIYDRWTPENPKQNGFFPRMRDYKDGHNYVNSTWWQKDMSFLRLKDLVFGYTLPTTVTNKCGISNMRIYFLANNLFTISDFDLWDVELGTSTGMKYPIMRSYNIGLELNF